MKNFNIYVSDNEPSQAVKLGWSWPGFIFTWIWALVKGLYPIGIGVLIGYVAIGYFGNSADQGFLASVVPIGVSIWLGLTGNKQREDDLLKKDFRHVAEVTAKNPDKALVAYLEEERKDVAG